MNRLHGVSSSAPQAGHKPKWFLLVALSGWAAAAVAQDVSSPPAAAPTKPADSNATRGRFGFKLDLLRPVFVAMVSEPDQRVGVNWLVSAEYYLARRHSLQADWLHNGGQRPRRVEGTTLQWRYHEASDGSGSVYYGALIGYRRLRWDNRPGPYGPLSAKMARISAGILTGGEVRLTKQRPQLTLGALWAMSFQEKVWSNQAFRYDDDIVHRYNTISFDNLNLDLRCTLGILL